LLWPRFGWKKVVSLREEKQNVAEAKVASRCALEKIVFFVVVLYFRDNKILGNRVCDCSWYLFLVFSPEAKV
jgi:hypothetical protein